MSAAEKSSIPGSWPGGSSDLPLITVHSQFIVHLSAIASSLWGLFPLLLRAVGDPPSSRDPLQRGKFRRRKRSLRLSQEKGEPLLKADSGPEDVPCTDALMEQRGLINGQANNEGTMNGRTSWGGRGAECDASVIAIFWDERLCTEILFPSPVILDVDLSFSRWTFREKMEGFFFWRRRFRWRS